MPIFVIQNNHIFLSAMKRIVILLGISLCACFCFAQTGPGSGRTLMFSNNATYRVNIPSAGFPLHPDNNLSVEAWIYPTGLPVNGGGVVFSKHETVGNREYSMFHMTNGLIRFDVFNNSSTGYHALSASPVPLNTWTHVAGTYSYSTGIARIYINGVLNSSTNLGNIIIATTNVDPLIGAYWLAGNSRGHFQGMIDEVRVWYTTRTEAQIRDNMCHTLSVPQAGLVAYYPLDELSGTTVMDHSGNGMDGTMENFPVLQNTDRYFSGAPIGNASINVYQPQPASWTGLTYTLNSVSPSPAAPVDARSLTVDNITGTPDGIHIYRVNSVPSQTGGLTNPSGMETYFGTFIVNESTKAVAVDYRAVYDYTPLDEHSCESSFALYTRNDNAVAVWNDLGATLDMGANTLIKENNTIRREFILDLCIPLPVDVIDYTVELKNTNEVHIRWYVLKEENSAAYYIERSRDALAFETLARIPSTGSFGYQYVNFLEDRGVYYYRLRQVDLDGTVQFFPLRSVGYEKDFSVFVYPNPAGETLFVKTDYDGEITVSLFDVQGKLVLEEIRFQQALSLNLHSLSAGIYFLKVKTGKEQQIRKIVKN